jgi:PAS domain-containing protein
VAERTAELRESEARFRALTELASDWYWEQDEGGEFTKLPADLSEAPGRFKEWFNHVTPESEK